MRSSPGPLHLGRVDLQVGDRRALRRTSWRQVLIASAGKIMLEGATTARAGRGVIITRQTTASDDDPLVPGDAALVERRTPIAVRVADDAPASVIWIAMAPEGTGALTPLRFLVLLLGFAAGWLALDRARAVEVVASFLRTGGAAQVSRFGFVFAALFWVGAALAVVAPGVATVVFCAAGVIGLFLATASHWERRLEWWGATSELREWQNLPLWVVAAFAFGALAFVAGRYPSSICTGLARRAASTIGSERSARS